MRRQQQLVRSSCAWPPGRELAGELDVLGRDGVPAQRETRGVLRGVPEKVVVSETVPAPVGGVDRVAVVGGEYVVQERRRQSRGGAGAFGGDLGEHPRAVSGREPPGAQVGAALDAEVPPAGLGFGVALRGEQPEQAFHRVRAVGVAAAVEQQHHR